MFQSSRQGFVDCRKAREPLVVVFLLPATSLAAAARPAAAGLLLVQSLAKVPATAAAPTVFPAIKG